MLVRTSGLLLLLLHGGEVLCAHVLLDLFEALPLLHQHRVLQTLDLPLSEKILKNRNKNDSFEINIES